MSDRFYTVIYIGGKVRPPLLQELITVINNEELKSQNDMTLSQINSEEELLQCKEKNGALKFYDERRAWGCFEDLEAFLVKYQIPFDRHHSPYDEYNGELAQYRSGMKSPQTAVASDSCEILVYAADVQKIRDMLRRCKSPQTVHRALNELNVLCEDLDVSPLPGFRIID